MCIRTPPKQVYNRHHPVQPSLLYTSYTDVKDSLLSCPGINPKQKASSKETISYFANAVFKGIVVGSIYSGLSSLCGSWCNTPVTHDAVDLSTLLNASADTLKFDNVTAGTGGLSSIKILLPLHLIIGVASFVLSSAYTVTTSTLTVGGFLYDQAKLDPQSIACTLTWAGSVYGIRRFVENYNSRKQDAYEPTQNMSGSKSSSTGQTRLQTKATVELDEDLEMKDVFGNSNSSSAAAAAEPQLTLASPVQQGSASDRRDSQQTTQGNSYYAKATGWIPSYTKIKEKMPTFMKTRLQPIEKAYSTHYGILPAELVTFSGAMFISYIATDLWNPSPIMTGVTLALATGMDVGIKKVSKFVSRCFAHQAGSSMLALNNLKPFAGAYVKPINPSQKKS